MDGTHAARDRLSVWQELIRNEHGLFRGGGEAGLPGKFGDEVLDAIVSLGMQTFGAAGCVAATWIQHLRALFSPGWGVRPRRCPFGAGYPKRWHRPTPKTGSNRVVSWQAM